MIDWVSIAAGPFRMGVDDFPPDEDETPQRVVAVNAFLISRVPVTDADERPLTYVSRNEAEAFCDRKGVRLPTEVEWEVAAQGDDDRIWPWGDELPDATRATFAQPIGGPSPVAETVWEKAARGTDGRTYPWGDDEDATRAAIGAGLKRGSPSPVGSHSVGASPYGLQDMAGNVWEWTATEYAADERVLRGGSYASPGLWWARCAMRSHSRPQRRQAHIGFRVARGDTHAR